MIQITKIEEKINFEEIFLMCSQCCDKKKPKKCQKTQNELFFFRKKNSLASVEDSP